MGASQDVVLVIDDYNRASSPEAEQLVDELARFADLRLVITTRMRPSWATARRLLYGEIHELGREMLAMDQEQARASCSQGQCPLRLVALAAGWPAVIGLAAASGSVDVPEHVLARPFTSSSLKRWSNHCRPRCVSRSTHLALRRLSRHASRTLCCATTQRKSSVRRSRPASCQRKREATTTYTPSFASFSCAIEAPSESSEVADDARLVAEALAHDGEWDAAFDVARRAALTDVIAGLFEAAGPELLRAGRTASLKAWADQANDLAITSPHIDLVAAEVAFRAGEPAAAESLALRAARHSIQAAQLSARSSVRRVPRPSMTGLTSAQITQVAPVNLHEMRTHYAQRFTRDSWQKSSLRIRRPHGTSTTSQRPR